MPVRVQLYAPLDQIALTYTYNANSSMIYIAWPAPVARTVFLPVAKSCAGQGTALPRFSVICAVRAQVPCCRCQMRQSSSVSLSMSASASLGSRVRPKAGVHAQQSARDAPCSMPKHSATSNYWLCLSVVPCISSVPQTSAHLSPCLCAHLPHHTEARVADSVVLRYPRAVTHFAPGCHANRPTQATSLPNVFMAGRSGGLCKNAAVEGGNFDWACAGC